MSIQTRRHFLATLSSAGAAGLVSPLQSFAQETPPETTTIRLAKIEGICVAPQYVAEGLLKTEGFSDVQYVDLPAGRLHPEVGTDKVDISMGFVAAFIVEVDLGTPIVLLGGVHTGCYELFGTKRVKAIRDLKGKTVAVPALGSSHHVLIASMAAYVGVDPKRDINFVTHPVEQSAQLLAEEKVDALIGFPPVPQEDPREEDRSCHRQHRPRSALGAVFLLHRCGQPGIRPQASGGDQAGSASDHEGNRLLCRRARARRALGRGQGLPLRLLTTNDERTQLRAMARLRS